MNFTIQELEHMKNKFSPIILDIGCACAFDGIHFGNTYKQGQVYAFEADPSMAKLAKLAIERDSIHNNITLIEKAVCHEDGVIHWHHAGIPSESPMSRFGGLLKNLDNVDDDNIPDWAHVSSSGTIKKPQNHLHAFPHVVYDDSTIPVPSVKLDTWFKEQDFEQIDFIWSDVNGAELEMIQGGIETFTNHVLYFYTECLQDRPNLWEGQPSKSEICRLLPDFEIVLEDSNDILFVNTRLI